VGDAQLKLAKPEELLFYRRGIVDGRAAQGTLAKAQQGHVSAEIPVQGVLAQAPLLRYVA
jgi:hypothetical protein